MSATTRIIAGVLVVLAIVLGILALFVGRRPAPAAQQSAAAPAVPTFPVVIAAQPLEAGVAITPEAVRIVQMPVHPVGAFIRTEDVIGHIPRVPVVSGMPLTAGGLNQGLPLTLKSGERGVAIPVDEVVGVGNAIQAGDLVDVFFSMKAPDGGGQTGGDKTLARLLLARVRVLAYGADSLVPEAAAAARDPNARSQARSAVLAIPVQDVDSLILASQSGRLTLALRYPQDKETPDPALFPAPRSVLMARQGLGADDKQRLDTPANRAFAGLDSLGLAGASGVTTPALVAQAARSAAPRAAPRPDFVEVIRGSELKRESLNGAGAAGAAGSAP